jgi:hypothetical protein
MAVTGAPAIRPDRGIDGLPSGPILVLQARQRGSGAV